MGIIVERVTDQDLARLAKVADGVFDAPPHQRWLADYLAAPGHLLVIAADGGLIVGQCAGIIHFRPDRPAELYVDDLGTADAYLRQGIATRMLAALFAWAHELGCGEAWLATELDNAEAISLYRKLGAAGDEIKYYQFKL